MIDYIIDCILGKTTKCWKCKYFLDHNKINELKLSNEPRDLHVGFCNKKKDFYESCSYNKKICRFFKHK